MQRPTRTITVQGHQVTIGGNKSVNRGLIKVGLNAIPLEIAKLAAGEDAWMRQIPVECTNCLCEFKLAESDSSELCPECYDSICAEND